MPGQTDRSKAGQIDIRADRQTERLAARLAGKQTDRQIDKQADRNFVTSEWFMRRQPRRVLRRAYCKQAIPLSQIRSFVTDHLLTNKLSLYSDDKFAHVTS